MILLEPAYGTETILPVPVQASEGVQRAAIGRDLNERSADCHYNPEP